jgi:hypothetical protein
VTKKSPEEFLDDFCCCYVFAGRLSCASGVQGVGSAVGVEEDKCALCVCTRGTLPDALLVKSLRAMVGDCRLDDE